MPTKPVIPDPDLRSAVDLAATLLRQPAVPRALAIWKAAQAYAVDTRDVARELNLRSQLRRRCHPHAPHA